MVRYIILSFLLLYTSLTKYVECVWPRNGKGVPSLPQAKTSFPGGSKSSVVLFPNGYNLIVEITITA